MYSQEASMALETSHHTEIVGSSQRMRDTLHEVDKVAAFASTVLIQGETGTGKELIARAVHQRSGRAQRPFVRVNCAAIPTNLFESELFGHEKGAFTGAITRRVGRFEQAQGGTLFLDEIGETPLELQPKLLRVLQEREFERVGGHQLLRADVRLVAATNCDLAAMVEARSFREDLYYRLNVFPIRVPALRERREDIPELVAHFMQTCARSLNKPMRGICPVTLDALVQHEWQGNIRELQNVVERAVIMASDQTLRCTVQRPSIAREAKKSTRLAEALDDVSRAHILSVLQSTNWVVSGPHGAAARLGMKRTTLNFRMKKLGIVRERDPLERASPSFAS